MEDKIILTNMFLGKLFKFYFYRNKKIFIACLNILLFLLISLVYIILFIIKLPGQIQNVQNGGKFESFLIIILLLVLILSIYLIVSYFRLLSNSKKVFFDEINQAFPLNSTVRSSFENGVIISKNSIVKHIDQYNLSDITNYYKFFDLYIIQACDDKLLLFTKEYVNNTQEFKESLKKIKKRFIIKENDGEENGIN